MFTLVAHLISGSLPQRSSDPTDPYAASDDALTAVPVRRDVMSEGLFADVLMREQRRADRFEQPSLLVLVTPDSELLTASTWNGVIDALMAAKREVDILGWLQDGLTLGVILTEFDVDNAMAMEKVKARIYGELATRLRPELRATIRLQLQVVGPSACAEVASDSAPEPTVELPLRRSSDHTRDFAKRALDLIGGLALLTVIAPTFLVLAALVRFTSRGPVFFRQVRVGEAAKPFTMLKFRTMYVDSDASIHQAYVTQFITAGAAAAEGKQDAPFKIVNDPRVTRIGRLLRKTSLDELPQLWNVVRGDMSLVGPRPPLPYEVAQYKPWHRRRVLDARPGITGLWQVTGRSRTTFDDMVRLDLRYARSYSAWMDIKILLATPRAVVSGKGAC